MSAHGLKPQSVRWINNSTHKFNIDCMSIAPTFESIRWQFYIFYQFLNARIVHPQILKSISNGVRHLSASYSFFFFFLFSLCSPVGDAISIHIIIQYFLLLLLLFATYFSFIFFFFFGVAVLVVWWAWGQSPFVGARDIDETRENITSNVIAKQLIKTCMSFVICMIECRDNA